MLTAGTHAVYILLDAHILDATEPLMCFHPAHMLVAHSVALWLKLYRLKSARANAYSRLVALVG